MTCSFSYKLLVLLVGSRLAKFSLYFIDMNDSSGIAFR